MHPTQLLLLALCSTSLVIGQSTLPAADSIANRQIKAIRNAMKPNQTAQLLPLFKFEKTPDQPLAQSLGLLVSNGTMKNADFNNGNVSIRFSDNSNHSATVSLVPSSNSSTGWQLLVPSPKQFESKDGPIFCIVPGLCL